MSERGLLGSARPLVLARLFTAVGGSVIPLVLARLLAIDEYGSYKQLLLIATTLHFVVAFGLPQSLYYFVPRAEHPRTWLGQTWVAMVGVGLLCAAGVLLFGEAIGNAFNNASLAEHRVGLALFILGLLASFPLEIGLTALGRNRAAAVSYLVSDGLRTVMMIVPVLLGWGLGGVMSALGLYGIARTLITWRVLLKDGTGPLVGRTEFREQLRYAAPFGIAVIANCAQWSFHQFAVSAALDPASFALYAVACFQLPLVNMLYTPISEVLMVRLGENRGRREALESFHKATALLMYGLLPMAGFLLVAAPEFIATVFGPPFVEAVPMFRVGLVGMAVTLIPVDAVLRARGDTPHILRAYVYKALLNVPLVLFALNAWGMMGAMVAFALTELVGLALLLWRTPRALESKSILAILPWRDLGRAAGSVSGAALICEAVSLSLTPLSFSPWMNHAFALSVLATVFTVVYLVLLRAGGLSLRELLELRRAARRDARIA